MQMLKPDKAAPSVMIELRIPGRWPNPGDLMARLPSGCRMTPRMLILPDGGRVDLGFFPPDGQFPKIFRSSCRCPPTEEELAIADGYKVNVTLSGSGGSLEAARTMMKAAAVLVRAGGAGVFIDNSVLAHGGELWLEMTEDGGTDALSFAFVGIVGGAEDIWTFGMHVLGFHDIVMKRTDIERGFDILELIRYMVGGEKPVEAGHFISDGDGSWFGCRAADQEPRTAGSPLHNPFGRLRLVHLPGVANNN